MQRSIKTARKRAAATLASTLWIAPLALAMSASHALAQDTKSTAESEAAATKPATEADFYAIASFQVPEGVELEAISETSYESLFYQGHTKC